MAYVDFPPNQQERIVCSISAAVKYRVPANIVLAIAQQEAGKPGQWVKNTNGTFDVGPMQFNTNYLRDLRKYGITAQDVAQPGCYPYELATWRLRQHIQNDQGGDIFKKAANYHSKSPTHNFEYRRDIVKKAAWWNIWLKARFETYDVTKSSVYQDLIPSTQYIDSSSHLHSKVSESPSSSHPHIHYNTAAAAALAAEFAPAITK